MTSKQDNQQTPISLELGDWVCERSEASRQLSPPMYVVGIYEDVVYLRIDSEQGDPFEVDLKDVTPIPISRKMLEDNGLTGCFGAYENNGRIAIIFNNKENGCNQRIPIKYVHELQHFMRLHGIGKAIYL